MTSPLKIVRVAVAMLAFALALEASARADDYFTYGAPFAGTYTVETLYTQDSLGRIGKPGARYRKWGMNELGFRGPPLEPGKINILTFGASETFGLYEDEGQEYPRQLERKLNERAGRDIFQVVNVAYAGTTASTANVRAPAMVDAVRPRAAIVYTPPANYIWLPWIKPVEPSPPPPPAPLPFEFRVGERLRTFAKGMFPQFVLTHLRAREVSRDAAGYPVVMDTLPEENVRRFRNDVTALATTLKARGVLPIIVTHASAFGPTVSADDRAMLVAWRKFYPMLKEEGFVDMERRMNDALRAVAAEQGVPLIDAAQAIPPTREHFADFVHFTNRGASVMADTLAKALLATLPEARASAATPPVRE